MTHSAAPIRVLMTVLNWDGGRGGIDRVAANLRDYFDQNDNRAKVQLINTRATGSKWTMPITFAMAVFRIAYQCTWKKCDVVHLNLATRGSVLRKMMIAEIARRCRSKLVIHVHGADFVEWYYRQRRWYRKRIISMFAKADAVIVLGKWWEQQLQSMGVEKLSIVYNGSKEIVDRNVCRGSSPVLIAVLGELGTRKGTDVLLKALAILRHDHDDWRCIVAGNGDLETYRGLVRNASLEWHVEIPGWLNPSETEHLLSRADIVALPSRAENLPMSIVEALGAGKAVIATPVGAIPEIVHEGVEGLLVPPGDELALAGALRKLIVDASLRNRMGENAREQFRSKLSINVFAENIYRVWSGVVTGEKLISGSSKHHE